MSYYAKDGSFVREASDDAPRMTQGDAWEAKQRVIKGMQDWENEEKRRKEVEKVERAEYQEIRKIVENKSRDAQDFERNQQQAIRIIVNQKRQEYNKKNWFGKAIAKLRGKTFAKMQSEMEEYAIKRVENMSPAYLESFIEKWEAEQKGRSK